jgi:hypothetical protein
MKNKSQKSNILLAVLGFIAVVVAAGLIGYFTMSKPKEIIQGEVEVEEYRVACKLPGRITSIKVKEGDFVHKGDVLAVLAIPEAKAQEKVVEATADATSALSDLASAPTRKEAINAAFQVYQQAIAARDIAEKTYGRMQRLYEEGVMTAQKKDEALAAFQTTKAGVEVAKSNLELLKSGARKQAKKAAKKQAQAAKSAVGVVKSILKETVQRATKDGEVDEIYPKEGELVGFGSPIMNILLTDEVKGVFNVREDQLKRLSKGKTFKVFVPALNKEITMVVTNIKDAGSYAVWKATKTNGQYDLRTFEIKAKPTQNVKGLLNGMSLIIK